MSDTNTTASDTDSVVQFGPSEWYGRRQLADRLDVSLRTIDRRVKRGEIEKRNTPNGKLYRPAPDETNRQEATADRQGTTPKRQQIDSDSAKGNDTKTTPDVSQGVVDLVALVRDQTDRIAALERQVGRLLERLDDQHSGAADTEPEDSAPVEPDETSEPDDDKTVAELVDALRASTGEFSDG